MIAYLPGYLTDIDRQPDREERSWEKQNSLRYGSWDEEALCLGKHNLYIKL